MDQHLFMDTKFWVCFRIFWNNANSQFNCFAKQKVYQTRTSTSDNTEHRKKQFMVQYPSCYKKNKFRQQLFLQSFRNNYTTYSKYFRQHLFLQFFRHNYTTYSKYFRQHLFLQSFRNNYTTYSKYFRKHLVLLDTSQVIKLLAKVKLVIGSLCVNTVQYCNFSEKRKEQYKLFL